MGDTIPALENNSSIGCKFWSTPFDNAKDALIFARAALLSKKNEFYDANAPDENPVKRHLDKVLDKITSDLNGMEESTPWWKFGGGGWYSSEAVQIGNFVKTLGESDALSTKYVSKMSESARRSVVQKVEELNDPDYFAKHGKYAITYDPAKPVPAVMPSGPGAPPAAEPVGAPNPGTPPPAVQPPAAQGGAAEKPAAFSGPPKTLPEWKARIDAAVAEAARLQTEAQAAKKKEADPKAVDAGINEARKALNASVRKKETLETDLKDAHENLNKQREQENKQKVSENALRISNDPATLVLAATLREHAPVEHAKVKEAEKKINDLQNKVNEASDKVKAANENLDLAVNPEKATKIAEDNLKAANAKFADLNRQYGSFVQDFRSNVSDLIDENSDKFDPEKAVKLLEAHGFSKKDPKKVSEWFGDEDEKVLALLKAPHDKLAAMKQDAQEARQMREAQAAQQRLFAQIILGMQQRLNMMLQMVAGSFGGGFGGGLAMGGFSRFGMGGLPALGRGFSGALGAPRMPYAGL